MPSKTLEDLKTEETNAIHTTEALKPSIKQNNQGQSMSATTRVTTEFITQASTFKVKGGAISNISKTIGISQDVCLSKPGSEVCLLTKTAALLRKENEEGVNGEMLGLLSHLAMLLSGLAIKNF